MSMNVLASKAGLAHSAISRIEAELRSPSLDTLIRIAVVLEVNLAGLFEKAFANASASQLQAEGKGRSDRTARSKGKT